MSKAKNQRWMLASVGFFGSLLAPGSVITQDDLGFAKVKDEDGKERLVAVAPPRDAIEVDEAGQPVDKRRSDDMAEILGYAAIPFGGAAPAQSPGGLQLAANNLNNLPAITAGHPNPADLAGAGNADAVHGTDPTVGNLSPDVIEALTSNPDFMRRMAEALGTKTPPVVEQQDANAAASGAKDETKPAAGANAQSAAPTRRGAATDDKK